MEKTETEKFFEGLPSNDQKIETMFETPATVPVEKTEEKKEEGEEPNNRQVRRMTEKLERERESAIALNDRIKQLAEENEKYKSSLATGADDRLTQIFGDDTPEKVALAKLFSDVLKDTKSDAKREALEEFQSMNKREQEEVELESKTIDSNLEALEDTYGVDLTSETASAKKLRNGFIDMIEKLSPKDANGDITEYADFNTTFQIYQSMNKPEASRNKELSAATMQASKTTDSSKDSDAAMEKFLNENGIRTR